MISYYFCVRSQYSNRPIHRKRRWRGALSRFEILMCSRCVNTRQKRLRNMNHIIAYYVSLPLVNVTGESPSCQLWLNIFIRGKSHNILILYTSIILRNKSQTDHDLTVQSEICVHSWSRFGQQQRRIPMIRWPINRAKLYPNTLESIMLLSSKI